MIIVICAWCKEKIKFKEKWQTITHPDQAYTLMKKDDVVSHGVCPECYNRMNQEMGQPPITEEASHFL